MLPVPELGLPGPVEILEEMKGEMALKLTSPIHVTQKKQKQVAKRRLVQGGMCVVAQSVGGDKSCPDLFWSGRTIGRGCR